MDKKQEAERIDGEISRCQNLAMQLAEQVDIAEEMEEWSAIQNARANLSNVQAVLQDYLDYKKRNFVLYEPDPELQTQKVPEQPEPEPIISMRQFYQEAAARDYITQDEAIGGLTGKIPQKIIDVIDKLPPDDGFKAKMLLLGADFIGYNNPLTDLVGQAIGLDRDTQKDFFEEAAKL